MKGSLRRISSRVSFACAMFHPFAGVTGLFKFPAPLIPTGRRHGLHFCSRAFVPGRAITDSIRGLHERAASSLGQGFSGGVDGAGAYRILFFRQPLAERLRARISSMPLGGRNAVVAPQVLGVPSMGPPPGGGLLWIAPGPPLARLRVPARSWRGLDF